MMDIAGLQKLTLLDYPGKVAATIFFGGCNYRCPFCHNGSLVLEPESNMTLHEVLGFLGKRRGILEGVCVTGGEPMLQRDLAVLLKQIKDLGFAVKLDTNGSFPEKLENLVADGLVDYVAVDIKNSQDSYGKTVGIPNFKVENIEKTVAFLKKATVPYEFRTTVVAELHTAEDFEKIGAWIAGCPAYFLQNFVDSGDLLQPGLHGAVPEEMMQYQKICQKYVENTQIRGL
ncbi:MAG: anaerobic ribonucleoside-triphosphate reductase activating protein [Eubacteriales bacterium]